jgi:hypothetical protein
MGSTTSGYDPGSGMWTQWLALEKVMGCSDQRKGCDGLLWMSWTSRLSLRYLLLLELLFRPPTIMLIDLLACWNGPLGLPVSGGEGMSCSSRRSSGCWLSRRRSSRRSLSPWPRQSSRRLLL